MRDQSLISQWVMHWVLQWLMHPVIHSQFWLLSWKLWVRISDFLKVSFEQAELLRLKFSQWFLTIWGSHSNDLAVNRIQITFWKIFMEFNPHSTLSQLKSTNDDVQETTLIILTTDQWWRRQWDNRWFAIIAWLFNWLSAKRLKFRQSTW